MTDFEHCPCCSLPTLTERGAGEMCPVCWWEDNATGDLPRARENYIDHFDCFEAGKGIGAVATPSPARRMLLAYLKSVREGERAYNPRTLHGLLRGLGHE